MSTPLPGYFIVLEGLDGSGTTTQSSLLCAELERQNFPTTRTFEPSAGPVGQLIRQALQHRLVAPTGAPHALDWTALALLFAADRMDHLHSTVLPALAAGRVVVSDRYRLSSFIYQSLTAADEGDALTWVKALNGHSRTPDLTVVLGVSAEEAERRRAARGGERELFEVSSFQARLAQAYLEAERFAPEDHVVHVSAEGPVEAVTDRILDVVRAALPLLG
ncbi:MAG: dTMP kinase [Polyangiaceae bacterium]|nr:dTMP kinase [Polyangiaceae bacterium]